MEPVLALLVSKMLFQLSHAKHRVTVPGPKAAASPALELVVAPLLILKPRLKRKRVNPIREAVGEIPLVIKAANPRGMRIGVPKLCSDRGTWMLRPRWVKPLPASVVIFQFWLYHDGLFSPVLVFSKLCLFSDG